MASTIPNEPDYFDDPEVEAQWCIDMHAEAERYLEDEQVPHGAISDWPAFRLAPHVALFAVASREQPGWIGLWVVCGDLPTDHLDAASIASPRAALATFASRWQAYCEALRSGAEAAELRIGDLAVRADEVLPMLESRARTLEKWAQTDAVWNGD
jgi:hypothetical protein